MRFKISEILESTVLLEGRLEDTKAKYPGNDEVIDQLSQADPSGNNKYLDWMTKQVVKNSQTTSEVIPVVKAFDQAEGRIRKQKFSFDINSYKTIGDVEEMMSKLKRREAPSKREIKGLGELVYDGDDVYVIAPRNYEGSCKFGQGSKWCVAMTNTDNYWNNYTKNNMFYFVTSKNLPTSDKNYKIAIQKDLASGKNTYWDVPDTSSSTPQNPEITAEVLSVIDKHFVEAKKHIFKRLLEDMLNGVKSTLTVDNIMRVKELANDGQLYKIISNDLMALNNLQLFNYVLDRIGNENMLKLMKTDFVSLVKLLNSDRILEFVDDNTTREEKQELASKLKPHLRTVSPNIRAKINKWDMSDADWERYNSMSTYIYMGNSETQEPISPIYKVDKFDPKSYDELSKLKLQLQYRDNAVIYGIVTGKGELDEYLGEDLVDSSVLSKFKKQVIPN